MRARHFIPLVLAASLPALPVFAQTDFQYQPYATPGNGGVVLAAPFSHVADFNGDGYADVLAPSTETCTGNTCTVKAPLYLYMNNGTGGLNAPMTLPVTLEGGSILDVEEQVVVSDFNGDGKLDIAALNNSGGITILYGKGDGTFQAPVNIALPAAGSLGYASLVEADFDVNNTQDLAAMTYDGKLVLLFNDGKGDFTQQSLTIDTVASGIETTSLTVGDFNADGRPDIAWVEQDYSNDSTDYVMSELNTAKGVFSAKHEVGGLPGTSYNFAYVRSADLDVDGKSDLVAWQVQIVEDCCSDTPVMAYYSNGNGTFTSGTTVASTSTDDVGVADINGDGNPDILIAGYQGVQVYEGTGKRTFTDDGTYTSLPGGAAQLGFGFFNDTNRVGFAAPNYNAYNSNDPDDFYLVQNDNQQLTCPYPASAGVSFCEAVQNGNSALVRGTARAQTQPVRHVELWANGKKLYQVFSDEFDATLNVAPGTAITAVEVEANGATRSATVTPTSVQTCDAPSSPGVNVCSPTQGEDVTSPVTFRAAGTGASGSVNHLELWIDGTKIGNYSGSTMDASVTEPAGSHTATVIEVDSKGSYVKSTPVTYTVGGTSGGGCAAPSSAGVDVCSPTNGSTVTSPVTFEATGTGASGTVNHLELWIDGTKIGNYSGATMDASVTVAAGSHSAQIVEVDSSGNYVKSPVADFTVSSSGGGGSCTAPSSPGVNVCEPKAGSTNSSPVSFLAAGTGASGSVNHLELWIDGTKIGNYSGGDLETSVSEAAGSHTATVIEVDSKGNYVKSTPVTYTVGTASSGFVSYVFDATQPLNGGEGNPPTMQTIGVESNGNESYGQVVDIPEFANGGIAANANYVFIPSTQSTIYAYKIGSDGDLTQGATTSTSAEGVQGPVFLDNTGQTLYSWTETTTYPEIVSWSIGANGALTMINTVSLNTGEPANPQVTFLPNNQTAYWTDCPGRWSASYEGFTRAANGGLTEFNPNMNFPAAPANTGYCPVGAAAADDTHVVIALMNLQNSNFGFNDTQLAVYTVNANGTLTTTNTTAQMPEVGALPNVYAFDSTHTWLALGDSNGLDLYKYSGGVLTHTDSLTLSGGVVQVNWDASGHLFLVGESCCGGTAVYTVTSAGQLTPAPDNGTWDSGLNPGILQTVVSAQ